MHIVSLSMRPSKTLAALECMSRKQGKRDNPDSIPFSVRNKFLYLISVPRWYKHNVNNFKIYYFFLNKNHLN